MYSRIKYSSNDSYCRYLDMALNQVEHPQKLCGGKFGAFLEKELDIKKLPYNIKLVDLMLEGCFSPDLFVTLPEEYFIKWVNYPYLSAKFYSVVSGDSEYADLFNVRIITKGTETSLDGFTHPYDLAYKEQFVNKFSTPIPTELKITQHPNGQVFYAHESYFSYWRAYILAEALEDCKFIDHYIDKQNGIQIFKESVSRINKKWTLAYSLAFNRISYYKTFVNIFYAGMSNFDCSYADVSNHLLNKTNSTPTDLETDLELLLTQYKRWADIKDSLCSTKLALGLLKKDIYFMYKWLCASGKSDRQLFDKWRYKDLMPMRWAQLQDVLDFDELQFSDIFNLYVPIYSKKIPGNWISNINIQHIYSKLESIDGFYPWIRAFSDMHLAINQAVNVNLEQPRILDNLLVFTIRTEILMRSLCCKIIHPQQEPYDLDDVIRGMATHITNPKAETVLKTVSGKVEWGLTMLRNRPQNIFDNIDNYACGKRWCNVQKYFFKCILKFVASRNYFAHHSYKDEDLKTHVSALSEKVLKSCLHTILYIADLADSSGRL